MVRVLKLHILASGSRGNAAVIEDTATNTGIMVDCGICRRDFFERYDAIGFSPENLAAILITHCELKNEMTHRNGTQSDEIKLSRVK